MRHGIFGVCARCQRAFIGLALANLLFCGIGVAQDLPAKPVYQVNIRDEKPQVSDLILPIDPVPRINLASKTNMAFGVSVDTQALNLEWMFNWFSIDGALTFPGNGGDVLGQAQDLPPGPGGKPRIGRKSAWKHSQMVITQEIEVVVTKATNGANRRFDAVIVRYVVENKDTQPHKLGIRAHWNEIVVRGNRGPLFAAPNHPDKILDGIELKGDKVPDYLRVLEKSNVKDPGFVAHITCNLGSGYEKPQRLVLSRGNLLQGDKWDAPVQPSGGNTGLSVFWDPETIKPKAFRKMAYAVGQGIAPPLDGDGLIALTFSGSFEPGKLFTIAAQVQDPAHGQSLTLELPPGMERVEGAERQPVPAVNAEGLTMVLWKARVLRTGEFNLRVHSSTGITQTKVITITGP